MLSSHHNGDEKEGGEVGEPHPLPPAMVTMIHTEEIEQPFITASVWGLILIILAMTVLISSEPDKKHSPVIETQ